MSLRVIGDGAAVTLLNVGDVLFDKGDFVGARKQFDEALPVFREIGAQRNIRATLERIGNVLYSVGKYARGAEVLPAGLALRSGNQ